MLSDLEWLTERVDSIETRYENEIMRLEARINELERKTDDERYDRERDVQRLEDKCGGLERELAYR